jgi:aminopeptidase N
MPGMNLTRDEARERAALVSVDSYDVELDLTTGTETFRSETTIRFHAAVPGSATFLDFIAPTVHEVTLNGRQLDVASVVANSRIPLPDMAVDNEVTVVADCAYSRTGEGLHRFVDPVDDAVYLYSQFETADARRMYACFEQPDRKATFTFTVIAPADWEVVSNSPTPTPVELRHQQGVARWGFDPTPRMSTYVTALVAGPYHAVRDSHGGVPLGVFCRRSLAEFLDADAILAVTKQGFDFFQAAFDYPYPFAKYDQLFVPDFNAGAMENAGCVTILEDYVFRSKTTDASYERRAVTILHELAHMWFGDLVTMRWWDDLWLNESFAEYASTLCQAEVTHWSYAWTTFANVEKAWAYRQDQLPTTHPIVSDIRDLEDVKVNFDGITYAKGASVLKQLVSWVGREEFFEGLRHYFRRHEWANTTLRDLLHVLEETSGRDLTSWSKEWLETAGVNTLRPSFEVDGDGRFTSFDVVQEAAQSHPTLRSHRLGIGLYERSTEGLLRRQHVDLDVMGERTPVKELIGAAQPDLVLLNDDDLTYTKIRLDERSQQTLLDSIALFSDSLARTLCWSASWDMTRDGEMAARNYLALVLSGVARESDDAVVQFLLRTARTAMETYADPAFRETGLLLLATGLAGMMRDAEPGSDHQLTFTRAFASVATSPEHLQTVRDLLDGSQALSGLTVDTDLRWSLLQRLVATGVADEAEIEAEQRRDDTATGQRHAALARAARPTEAAKAQAWRDLVERQDLPNTIQFAITAGFMQPTQRDLLRPYVPRYFASIKDVWASRSPEMAQNIVQGLYPTLLAEQGTLQATDEWLGSADPVPALRRLVVEGRDGVARALRNQERDRAAG